MNAHLTEKIAFAFNFKLLEQNNVKDMVNE